MPQVPESIRIILAHRDETSRKVLETLLEGALHHEVILSTSTGRELVTTAREQEFDLFISSVLLDDGDAIDFLIEASKDDPKPSLIVTKRHDLEHVERALEDHVMSYLVEPVSEHDLRPSIHLVLKRFEEFQALRREVSDLKQALQARKVIERAKGVLMREKGVDEVEAYRRLQELASRKRTKLIDVANAILLASEL